MPVFMLGTEDEIGEPLDGVRVIANDPRELMGCLVQCPHLKELVSICVFVQGEKCNFWEILAHQIGCRWLIPIERSLLHDLDYVDSLAGACWEKYQKSVGKKYVRGRILDQVVSEMKEVV